MAFEIGVMTFGEDTEGPVSGTLRTPHQRARGTIELAKSESRQGSPMGQARPAGPEE